MRGHVGVIEFQKRGLPHAHILVTLDPKAKMTTADKVDAFISAQLPDKEEHPNLYERVVKHNLHGPHRTINDPCMKQDKRTGKKRCRFHYPKNFADTTTLNEDGIPSYARPNNGRVAQKGEYTLDNRSVVPYNPRLTLTFDCHINVERCFDMKSIKYLYKYIYKGPDKIELKVSVIEGQESITHDECTKFIDGRYISAPEGCWHILRKKV